MPSIVPECFDIGSVKATDEAEEEEEKSEKEAQNCKEEKSVVECIRSKEGIHGKNSEQADEAECNIIKDLIRAENPEHLERLNELFEKSMSPWSKENLLQLRSTLGS